MRIAIVTSSYWPVVGGQMIYARVLARELVQQGHNITVLTRFTKRLASDSRESQLRIGMTLQRIEGFLWTGRTMHSRAQHVTACVT